MTFKQFKKLKNDDLIQIKKLENSRVDWNEDGLMDKYDGMVLRKDEFTDGDHMVILLDGDNRISTWMFGYDCLSVYSIDDVDDYNRICFEAFVK